MGCGTWLSGCDTERKLGSEAFYLIQCSPTEIDNIKFLYSFFLINQFFILTLLLLFPSISLFLIR